MAVTKSWTASGVTPAVVATANRGARPQTELSWLIGASLVIAAALGMVYAAKTRSFAAEGEQLRRGELVDLNHVSGAEQLAPVLAIFPEPKELGESLAEFLTHRPPLKNVGAIARVPAARRVLNRLKPLLVVRTPAEFQRAFLLWTVLYFGGFYMVVLVWRRSGFRGDRAYLPVVHLLTGIGLALMVSLRDPLRDTLEFQKFALGDRKSVV